jgi:NAD(P)H-flavin reductase
MKKLEAGEITTEQAKEINDLAYDKYIMEGVFDKIKKSKESKKKKKRNSKMSMMMRLINFMTACVTFIHMKMMSLINY